MRSHIVRGVEDADEAVGINGNIIANPGFVAQFATETNAQGERILSASVLSAIGTIQSVGQIIGMVSLPL